MCGNWTWSWRIMKHSSFLVAYSWSSRSWRWLPTETCSNECKGSLFSRLFGRAGILETHLLPIPAFTEALKMMGVRHIPSNQTCTLLLNDSSNILLVFSRLKISTRMRQSAFWQIWYMRSVGRHLLSRHLFNKVPVPALNLEHASKIMKLQALLKRSVFDLSFHFAFTPSATSAPDFRGHGLLDIVNLLHMPVLIVFSYRARSRDIWPISSKNLSLVKSRPFLLCKCASPPTHILLLI